MTDFDATPFFRVRLHIGEASTQKDKGKLIRDITVEYGNQDTKKIIRTKEDIADIEEKDIVTHTFDIWDKSTLEGHKRGKVFIDEEVEQI
jgi:Cu/Ag efflux protein CusF